MNGPLNGPRERRGGCRLNGIRARLAIRGRGRKARSCSFLIGSLSIFARTRRFFSGSTRVQAWRRGLTPVMLNVSVVHARSGRSRRDGCRGGADGLVPSLRKNRGAIDRACPGLRIPVPGGRMAVGGVHRVAGTCSSIRSPRWRTSRALYPDVVLHGEPEVPDLHGGPGGGREDGEGRREPCAGSSAIAGFDRSVVDIGGGNLTRLVKLKEVFSRGVPDIAGGGGLP
jgi:hypothetical protein